MWWRSFFFSHPNEHESSGSVDFMKNVKEQAPCGDFIETIQQRSDMISAVSDPERVTHHFHRIICDWIIQAAVEFSVPTLTALAAIDYVNRCLAVKTVDKCMLSLMANS